MIKQTAVPFGLRDKIGYLMGDIGNDFTFIFASTYVMVFYSKVMGISTGLIGTMFVIARCLDAFTDIGMGRIVDRMPTEENGRFRPWILRMCGPVALASFLMYQSGMQNAPYRLKVIYMFVTYILWGSVFYTSINIPYGSMVSVLSPDVKDRSSLSVFRSMGASIASIGITTVTPLIVYYTDANGNQLVSAANFTRIAGFFSILAVVAYLLCYYLTTERVVIEPCKEKTKISRGTFLSEIFSSRALIGIIFSAILLLLATLMTQGVNNYLFADYFRNTKALAAFGMLQLPVMLILALVSTRLSVRFGKKECSAAGMAFAGVLFVCIGLSRITNVYLFMALVFLAMLGMYFLQMQCYAMVSDVIDEKEVRTGVRDDGTIYGIYSFARKIGQAIAGGISGWALAFIGYDELAAAQSTQVADSIYKLATLFPGIVYLLCAAVLTFLYPLGKRQVEYNVAELEKRRRG